MANFGLLLSFSLFPVLLRHPTHVHGTDGYSKYDFALTHSDEGVGAGRGGLHGGDPVRADSEGGLGRAHAHPLVQGHLRHTNLQVCRH